MLGAEPFDRFPDQNDIDTGENRQNGRKTGARGGIVDGPPQHEISEVNQQAYEVGRQARIPGPPNTPNDASPNTAGANGDQREGQRNFVDGCSYRIEPQILLHQVPDGRKHADVEAGERRQRSRDMEINDAKDRALVRFVGNLKEDAAQIPSQNQAGDHGQGQDNFHAHASPPQPTKTTSTSANDNRVNRTLNATKMRNQIMFSASDPPRISTRLSSIAPSSAGISMG